MITLWGRNNSTNVKKVLLTLEELELPYEQILAGREFGINHDADFLALIVRALVKHPTLLILDEPLQGLDPLNRQLIRRFVDVLISEGETQLLFVSHHAEDAPACITHRLEFVPDGGLYRYVLTKIY